jgi:hypothetical protein
MHLIAFTRIKLNGVAALKTRAYTVYRIQQLRTQPSVHPRNIKREISSTLIAKELRVHSLAGWMIWNSQLGELIQVSPCLSYLTMLVSAIKRTTWLVTITSKLTHTHGKMEQRLIFISPTSRM